LSIFHLSIFYCLKFDLAVGFDVSINLIDAGFVPAMRSARTDVRSNMVNGMPPRKKSARPEPGKPAGFARGMG
jgi:hypothetical protein